MSVVIDLSDIFLTNFAQLPLGYLDRSRTTWHKVKAFAEQPRARGPGDLQRRPGGRDRASATTA